MKINMIRQSGSRKFGKSDAQPRHNGKKIRPAVSAYHHSHIYMIRHNAIQNNNNSNVPRELAQWLRGLGSLSEAQDTNLSNHMMPYNHL